MKTSCIQHVPKSPLVVLHQDYLDICDNNQAAAIILKTLEYWTDVKIAGNKQLKIENQLRQREGLSPIDTDVWIYKTYNDFIDDSLGLLKLYQVKAGLSLLLEKGFISKRNNPKFKWDRTLQYCLNTTRIQSAINNLSIGHIQPMEDVPITDQSSTDNQTIPETTPETTTEIYPPPDFLEHIVAVNGKTNNTLQDTTDQFFGNRDGFLKAWEEAMSRSPGGVIKDMIVELSNEDGADLQVWQKALRESITNYPGGNKPPINRVIEVYRTGGDYEVFVQTKWGNDNPIVDDHGRPPAEVQPEIPVLTEDVDPMTMF